MVGKRVLILGSGDIGLIMARRMTLEGAKVLACVEVMPHPGGLTRNIVQCLQDFDIPLYLSHTIVDIQGEGRVERAVVAEVGPDRKPVPGTEMTFDVDTILLSVGLIPENELTRQAGIQMDARTRGAVVHENMETSVSGIFACGNVLQVHDLVDFVSEESAAAGAAAAAYVLDTGGAAQDADAGSVVLEAGDGVSYTVPQRVRVGRLGEKDKVTVSFRVRSIMGKSRVVLTCDGEEIASFRRPRMAPGEMERVKIARAKLAPVVGGGSGEPVVTVSVEEVE